MARKQSGKCFTNGLADKIFLRYDRLNGDGFFAAEVFITCTYAICFDTLRRFTTKHILMNGTIFSTDRTNTIL